MKWHGEDFFTVKHGITRTVALAGPWVIKVPSARAHGEGLRGLLWSLARGIVANQSEWDWRGSAGVCSPATSLLGGLVNVYPRALVVPEDRIVDFDAIGYVGPTDKKNVNLGILNEKIVWIDYAQDWNDGLPCKHVHRSRR